MGDFNVVVAKADYQITESSGYVVYSKYPSHKQSVPVQEVVKVYFSIFQVLGCQNLVLHSSKPLEAMLQALQRASWVVHLVIETVLLQFHPAHLEEILGMNQFPSTLCCT